MTTFRLMRMRWQIWLQYKQCTFVSWCTDEPIMGAGAGCLIGFAIAMCTAWRYYPSTLPWIGLVGLTGGTVCGAMFGLHGFCISLYDQLREERGLQKTLDVLNRAVLDTSVIIESKYPAANSESAELMVLSLAKIAAIPPKQDSILLWKNAIHRAAKCGFAHLRDALYIVKNGGRIHHRYPKIQMTAPIARARQSRDFWLSFQPSKRGLT